VKVTGQPVTVALNRTYLTHALRFGLNELVVEDELSPVVFSSAGKKLIIMPINLNGPARVQVSPQPASQPTTAEKNQPSPQPEAQTEERTEMPRTARATTPEPMTTYQPVEPANNNGHGSGNGNGSGVKALVEHVEQIKENLKGVIRDLNGLIDTVKLAEKERKSSEKEIETIRSKLRQIQSVAI
jgi:hypothetical protein